MKKRLTWLMSIAIIAATLGLMAFAPLSQPASPAPLPTRIPRTGEQLNQQMADFLMREQNWLQRQTIQLNNANQLAVQTQKLITAAQANGFDTSSLSAALATLNTQIAAAQPLHAQAASILSAKNGFDANNQVTDYQTARTTLVDARSALHQAGLDLQNGILALRTVVNQWRLSHNI